MARPATLNALLRQSVRLSPTTTTTAVLLPRRRPFHTAPILLAQSSSSSSSSSSTPGSATAPAPSLPEFTLQGKVIFVSGGGRGLGLAQTEALLEAGATVHVLDRLPASSPSPEFVELASRIAKASSSHSSSSSSSTPPLSSASSPAPLFPPCSALAYHQCDVRDQDALHGVVEAAVDASGGRVDGLIAAAAIQQEISALEYTTADADRLLGVNVTGVLVTAQAIARQMVRRKTGGSMVLVASMSGTVANKGLICPLYNASKAAVVQLGRNLAAEWGVHGIRVNTLSPGYIATAMTANLFDEQPERRAKWSSENMLGRLSDPREYRGAAVFLLSDASSFMTGSDLRIDGGHSAW